MAMQGKSARAKSLQQDPTLPHIAFAVENITAAKNELDAMHVPYWRLDALGPEDARQQIFLSDPSGGLIELHQEDTCRCTLRNRLTPSHDDCYQAAKS